MKYLVKLLNKETKVYQDYLELAAQKKRALIENDYESLEAITVQEKVLSSKILKLESERQDYLNEHGFRKDITLNELIQDLPEHEKNQLSEASEKLKASLMESRKFNNSNMALLRQSSNYINHMMKTFSRYVDGDQPTYGKGVQGFKAKTKIADLEG